MPGSSPVGEHVDPARATHEIVITRCSWCEGHDDYVAYHDQEWGRPETDDLALFDKLCLEVFQCGLSWLTVLRKRERLREVFAGFDPAALDRFGEREVEIALTDPGIIRHRAKIAAILTNARALRTLWDSGECLGDLVWSIAPLTNPPRFGLADVPAATAESEDLARMLKGRGFRFLGPTTVYAFMQSMGVVNDHLLDCHVHEECEQARHRVLAGGRGLS